MSADLFDSLPAAPRRAAPDRPAPDRSDTPVSASVAPPPPEPPSEPPPGPQRGQLDLTLHDPGGTQQLLLDLPRLAGSGRDDMVVTQANAVAASYLDAWPDWSPPLVILSGPSGAGKSHLARCWAARAGAHTLDPRGLRDVRLGDEPFLIEDIDRALASGASGTGVAGTSGERDLFHIVNAARARGLTGVLTARFPPTAWGLALPDLLSRLRAATQLELDVPDAELVAGVAMTLFAERQLAVGPDVVETIVARADRSLKHVAALVRRLGYLSMTRGRAVTRALVLEALRQEAAGL